MSTSSTYAGSLLSGDPEDHLDTPHG